MKLPLNTDLTGKTVVITGAGGVLWRIRRIDRNTAVFTE